VSAKVLVVFGTRPEAIKMAPVIRCLREHRAGFDVVVGVTAQHREMLDQVLDLFGITPDHDLGIMRHGQTLDQILARAVTGLSELVRDVMPDVLLVQGDTATTLAGALAGFYEHIPVGHVEAGLRSDDKYRPFPEEVNRRLTTHVASLHFAPTQTAADRLAEEGVVPEDIWVTGNTVVDALLETAGMPFEFTDQALRSVLSSPGRVVTLTAHRRENWGEPMRRICRAALEVLRGFEDVHVVFPVHRNPVVRRDVESVLGGHERAHLVEPLEYLPFVKLLQSSTLVMSDSGGIQEEAPSLDLPVLCLRDTTERPEAIETGAVRLVGTDEQVIAGAVAELLTDSESYRRMAAATNPFGDGRAATRIADVLAERW